MTLNQWISVGGLGVGPIAVLLPLLLIETGGRSIATENGAIDCEVLLKES